MFEKQFQLQTRSDRQWISVLWHIIQNSDVLEPDDEQQGEILQSKDCILRVLLKGLRRIIF